jgi:hypothetical protein
VNRVHPEKERLVTINKGFDHEVAHRAIARIEGRQGRAREVRGAWAWRRDDAGPGRPSSLLPLADENIAAHPRSVLESTLLG